MKKRLLIIAIVASVCVVALAWMFRVRTDNNDPRGVVRYRWKWGRASEISIDRDRDGRADVRVLYPGTFRDFASDDPPREMWADQNFDGRFDVMWRREDSLIVRRDANDDGILETEIRGADAERFKADLTLFK